MQHSPEHLPVAAPPPAPPERIQRMVDILIANQHVICQHGSGTVVFQFQKNEVQAKVTYTLPS